MSSIWTINSVQALNEFNIVNSSGITYFPGIHPIWDRTQNWEDGPSGSKAPVMFRNTMSSATAQLNISVSGTAAFPPSWRVAGSVYQLVGYLNGTNVLQSSTIPVPMSGNAIQVGGLYLMAPNFANRQVAIPFRHGGDFSWTLWLYKDGHYGKYEIRT
jgi:hypothetical protein